MFLGYAGLGILAGLFVNAFVAETKRRSLEEIEANLQRAAGGRVRRRGTRRQTAVPH